MFNRFSLVSFFTLGLTFTAGAELLVDFDDLPLSPDSYYNGSDQAGGFTSRQTFFRNEYSPAFSAWQGFSYSNQTDTTTAGYGNEFSSYAGGGSGADGSAVAGNHFAIAFGFGPADAYFNIPQWARVDSIRVTNTTLTALDMRDGSPFGFSKKFGGASGNDEDWFKVVFTGYDQPHAQGNMTSSVEFYLADFRFGDNQQDFILDTWELVDLSMLGDARSVALTFASSDVGIFGINTPTYVAVDNLNLVPEPATAALMCAALLLAGRLRNRS